MLAQPGLGRFLEVMNVNDHLAGRGEADEVVGHLDPFIGPLHRLSERRANVV